MQLRLNYRRKVTDKQAFSLISVMVAIVIIGIMAVMAKPSVDAIYTRARMAEARSNLEFIKRSQGQWFLSTGSGAYEEFPPLTPLPRRGIGYIGGGSYNCPTTFPVTFAPGACKSLRYNYVSDPYSAGSMLEVVAFAPSDMGRHYVYAGCNGAGSTIHGHSQGDVWAIRNQSQPQHCRNILAFCPSPSGSATNGCTQPRIGTAVAPSTP